MSTSYDAMSSAELEAHITSLIKEQKEEVKGLRALLRVKQTAEAKAAKANASSSS